MIRTATDADWPLIWPFFGEIVEAGETYAYPLDLTPDGAKDLWMPGPPFHTVVMEGQGTVDGSALMGPNRPGRGNHIGTASFMVRPGARGRGVGRALAEHALDRLSEQGYRGVQFNAVVESNAGAVHLWESLGFGIVGTVPEAFRSATHGYVGLHVMFKSLV